MRAPMTMSAHEVPKWGVMVRRWSGDTIGPAIIVAPQRGHTQVARTGVSVVDVVSEGALAVGGVASTVWARAGALRDTCSREIPTGECVRSRAAGCAGRRAAESPRR